MNHGEGGEAGVQVPLLSDSRAVRGSSHSPIDIELGLESGQLASARADRKVATMTPQTPPLDFAVDLERVVAAIGAHDGYLAQRLLGAAAAIRSAVAGDDLNTPPPPLPDGWTPTTGVIDTGIANQLAVLTDALAGAGPKFGEVADRLRSYVTATTNTGS